MRNYPFHSFEQPNMIFFISTSISNQTWYFSFRRNTQFHSFLDYWIPNTTLDTSWNSVVISTHVIGNTIINNPMFCSWYTCCKFRWKTALCNCGCPFVFKSCTLQLFSKSFKLFLGKKFQIVTCCHIAMQTRFRINRFTMNLPLSFFIQRVFKV